MNCYIFYNVTYRPLLLCSLHFLSAMHTYFTAQPAPMRWHFSRLTRRCEEEKNPSQFILLKISQFSLSSEIISQMFCQFTVWGVRRVKRGRRAGWKSISHEKDLVCWFFPSKMAALKRTHMTAISNLFHFYLLPNTKTAYVSQDGIMRDEAMKLANSIDSYFTRSFESYAMCRWSHYSVTRIQSTTSYVGKLKIDVFLVFIFRRFKCTLIHCSSSFYVFSAASAS